MRYGQYKDYYLYTHWNAVRLRKSAANSSASCINHITSVGVKNWGATWRWLMGGRSDRGSFSYGSRYHYVAIEQQPTGVGEEEVVLFGGAIAIQLTINSTFNWLVIAAKGLRQCPRCHAWRCLINIAKYNWRFDVEICTIILWPSCAYLQEALLT